MTQETTWNILGMIGLTLWTQSFFSCFLGPCLLATSRDTGWIDIHEIFRIWTREAIGYTVSRLSRLFHALQTGAAEVCALRVLLIEWYFHGTRPMSNIFISLLTDSKNTNRHVYCVDTIGEHYIAAYSIFVGVAMLLLAFIEWCSQDNRYKFN